MYKASKYLAERKSKYIKNDKHYNSILSTALQFGPVKLKYDDFRLYQLHRHLEDYVFLQYDTKFPTKKQSLAKIGTIL